MDNTGGIKKRTLMQQREGRGYFWLRVRGRTVKRTRPEPPIVLWFTALRDSAAGSKIWVRGLLNIGKSQSPAWR